MIFTSENTEDILRYYKNTWVKLEGHGDTIFKILGISHSENGPYVYGVNTEDIPLEIWLSKPYKVSYTLPHKSYFMHGKHAHFLFRKPARMFKRGICNENTSILSLRDGQFTNKEVTQEILLSYINKPLFEKLDSIIEKQSSNSFCLSSRMAFCGATGQILIDTKPIALVRASIELIYKEFLPEIKSLGSKREIVC